MSEKRQNAIPYYTKERCLKSAIAELIDDYEALKREVNELREHNKYLESRISEESDYAILESKFKIACAQNKALLEQRNSILARHNALVEVLRRIAYADMWTLEKDGSDAGEQFQQMAEAALVEEEGK